MSRSRKTSVSVVLGGKVDRVFRMHTGYISAEELGKQYGYKPKPNDSMQDQTGQPVAKRAAWYNIFSSSNNPNLQHRPSCQVE